MTTSPKPTKDEALKLALTAVTVTRNTIAQNDTLTVEQRQEINAPILEVMIYLRTAIREALAQPADDDKAGGEASTDWERIARVQDAKLRAMCNEPGGFEKLREVMDRYEATRPQPQAAQPAERVALTKNQRDALLDSVDWYNFPEDLIIATEMKHGITAKEQS